MVVLWLLLSRMDGEHFVESVKMCHVKVVALFPDLLHGRFELNGTMLLKRFWRLCDCLFISIKSC